MRKRRPGVWEVRVAAGTDPATGRTRQRSVTVHGTASDAEASRRELVAARDARRARPSPLLSLGELLELWLAAGHPWKPSTRVGYESNARRLRTDTRSSRPKPAWATRMRPRPCASTPTPSLSPTPRSPIASTHTSIGPPCEPTRPRRFSP